MKVSSPSTTSACPSSSADGSCIRSQNGASEARRPSRTARTRGSSASPGRTASSRGRDGRTPSAASTPAALACVSATSPAGSEPRTRVAPTGTRSRPAASMSAVRIRMGESSVCAPPESRPSRASAPA
ncbi:hypothetical protein SGLAM104S_06631 [Streptomyces glaucescens]